MSVTISSRVWKRSKQHGSNLVVMLALADFSDDYGICWPNLKRIAEYARTKERNARYILNELEVTGEILRIINPGRSLRSYIIVTLRQSTPSVYKILRQQLEIDKQSAKSLIIAWKEKRHSNAGIEAEKGQQSAASKRGNRVQQKGQSSAEKGQQSATKGAIQRPPYKEGTIMNHHEPSLNRPLSAHAASAPLADSDVKAIRTEVPAAVSPVKQPANDATPDAQTQMWYAGVALLMTSNGMTKATASAFMGSLLSPKKEPHWTREELIRAVGIAIAERPADAKAYIIGVLKGGKGNGKQSRDAANLQRFFEQREANLATFDGN